LTPVQCRRRKKSNGFSAPGGSRSAGFLASILDKHRFGVYHAALCAPKGGAFSKVQGEEQPMKHGLSLLILAVLLLLVAACGGGDDQPAIPAGEAPAVATEAVAQQPPAAPAAAANTPIAPTASPVPPIVTPEPDDEPLGDVQLAALENLDSFRLLMTYASKGIDAAGNAVDNSAEIITEYTKNPEARRTMINFIDNTPDADADDMMGSMETYQIGQDMYMFIDEDMGWMRVSMDDSILEDSLMGVFSGGDFFTNLDQMRRVRPDQRINGIDSRHYQFDERVLATIFDEDMDDISATGDIWIAKDGDYITKYVLTMTFKDSETEPMSGELASGTVEIIFELQDVNSDIKIEIPMEATAGVSLAGFEGQSLPLPEGARVQAASANFTMIESDAPASEVVAFFEEALPGLGWIKDEQGSVSFGNMTSLTFSKGSVQLSLMINVDEETGMTQIMANAQ
jgi:hypothetical protein